MLINRFTTKDFDSEWIETTFTSAISPQYMGTTVKANAKAKPRTTRATHNWITYLAVPIKIQPIRKGTTADNSVIFLPNLWNIGKIGVISSDWTNHLK